MEQYVRHCVLTWNIENLALSVTEMRHMIFIPTFSLGNQIPTLWDMWFFANERKNDEKVLSSYLKIGKASDENSDKVVAFFKLVCKDAKNGIFFRTAEVHQSIELIKYGFSSIKQWKTIKEDLESEDPIYNSITLTWEMYIFVTRKKSAWSTINFVSTKDIGIHQMSTDMKILYSSKVLADLEIKLENGEIKAHKAILSARSEVFAEMLKDSARNSVELLDVKLEIMDKFLAFLYTGGFEDLQVDDYSPFLLYESAKRFRMPDILRFLAPEEISARSTLNVNECGLTWCIENFSRFDKLSTESARSPVFKYASSCSKWRIRFQFDGKDSFGVFVERLDKNFTFPVLLTMSILDNKGWACFTKRAVTSSEEEGDIGFHSFVKREDLSRFVERDVLTLRCTLKYSGEEHTTLLEKISDVSDVGCRTFGTLSQDFRMLLQSGYLSDVVLVAGERKFNVHRVILSARSPVFACMFKHDMREKQTGEVIIDDLESDVLETLLQYMYSGKFCENLSSQKITFVYSAAEKYAVRTLKLECSRFLQSNFEADCVCAVLIVADLHGDAELKNAAETFIRNNLDQVLQRKEWQEIVTHHSALANKLLRDISFELGLKRKEK